MSERMTRRDFLVGAAGIALGYGAKEASKYLPETKGEQVKRKLPEGYRYPERKGREELELFEFDNIWKYEILSDKEKLSFDEVSQIALRLDRIVDVMPEVEIPANEKTAIMILTEYNNFFVTEGMVDESGYPNMIAFEIMPPTRHDAVLGTTDCETRILFNVRQMNPVSSWYNRSDWLWTVVHESAHIHQGKQVCNGGPFFGPHTLVEATAELMTAEVMASRANRGDKNAFIALMDALRGWSVGTALARAIESDRISDFEKLRDKLNPNAVSKASYEKTMRKYKLRQQYLYSLLDAYNAKPLEIAIDAMRNNYALATDLALPEKSDFDYGRNNKYIPALNLDDLAYTVEHAEELALEYLRR